MNKPLLLGSNLTRSLLDTIGSAIVTGSYDLQPFPTEAELARKFGVSRSVTREAVKMLTAKGLLSARPRQGTAVTSRDNWNMFDPDVLDWLLQREFSLELLHHFLELRAAIEPAAAEMTALNADATGLEGVARGFQRMELAAVGRDDVLDADIAFHVAILVASGNPFFAQFRSVVVTALKTSIRHTNRLSGHDGPDMAAHAAVNAAIQKGRPAAARKAMQSLLAFTRAVIDRPIDQVPHDRQWRL